MVDRLRVIEDRGGTVHARLAWSGDALERLVVGEPGSWTIVSGAREPHPIFGEAHPIWIDRGDLPRGEGAPATWMGAVAWAAPTTIPPIFAPARLPGGAGTMILNVLARLARDAGVAALRYAGPYPTAALWRSLQPSFRVLGDASEDDFTAGALARAVAGDMSPIAIDLAPAPFERRRVSARVTVDVRDGVERVTLDGAAFERPAPARRLVARADGWAAELWLGERRWCTLAAVDHAGDVLEGPAAPRPVDGELAAMLGARLPPAMCAALADVVAELVAAPLAAAARAELASADVAWGDPGAAVVADRDGTLIVHAGLWAHTAGLGLARVARALAVALAPPIAARAQARLAAAVSESPAPSRRPP